MTHSPHPILNHHHHHHHQPPNPAIVRPITRAKRATPRNHNNSFPPYTHTHLSLVHSTSTIDPPISLSHRCVVCESVYRAGISIHAAAISWTFTSPSTYTYTHTHGVRVCARCCSPALALRLWGHIGADAVALAGFGQQCRVRARAREREPQNERICLVCSTRARVHGCSWDAEVTIDAEIRGFSIGEECGGDDD